MDYFVARLFDTKMMTFIHFCIYFFVTSQKSLYLKSIKSKTIYLHKKINMKCAVQSKTIYQE